MSNVVDYFFRSFLSQRVELPNEGAVSFKLRKIGCSPLCCEPCQKMNPRVIVVLNRIVSRVNFSNKIRSIKGGQIRLFYANFRSLIEPCRALE